MFATNCNGTRNWGKASCCYDTTNQWYYYWDASSTAFLPEGQHTTLQGLIPCVAGQNGLEQYITNSTTIAAEGQTCAATNASTVHALAVCLGTTWKCF